MGLCGEPSWVRTQISKRRREITGEKVRQDIEIIVKSLVAR